MAFLQVTVLALLGVTVVSGCLGGGSSGGGSSGGGSGGSTCRNGGGSGLTKLYNTCVVRAQRYKRPLLTSAANILAAIGIYHQGVVVTLNTGAKWLVHKGDEYGAPSETVVVVTTAMSPAWFPSGSSKSVSRSNVGDYVDAGGKNYDVVTDNCINASTE